MPEATKLIASIEEAFRTSPRGLLDFVDRLLLASQDCRVVLETPTVGTQIHCTVFPDSKRSVGTVIETRRPIFRAMLARFAFLCEEQEDVSPDGGEGRILDHPEPGMEFRITFVNTPSKQRLELISVVCATQDGVDLTPPLRLRSTPEATSAAIV